MHRPAGQQAIQPSAESIHASATNRKPRAPNAFKHRDVQRALKAARAAGFDVAGFRIGVQKVW